MPVLNTTGLRSFHSFANWKKQLTLLWVPGTWGRTWIIAVKYTKIGLESFNGNPWRSSSNAKERAEGGAEKRCPRVNTALQPWSEMNGRPSVRDRQTNNCFPSALTSLHQAPGPPPLCFISPNPKQRADMNSFLQTWLGMEKNKLLPVL